MAFTIASVSPDHVPCAGGTEVMLTGTDLASLTQVRFAGVPASGLVIDSPTQARCTPAAHAAGIVDLDADYVVGIGDGSSTVYNFFTSGVAVDRGTRYTLQGGSLTGFNPNLNPVRHWTEYGSVSVLPVTTHALQAAGGDAIAVISDLCTATKCVIWDTYYSGPRDSGFEIDLGGGSVIHVGGTGANDSSLPTFTAVLSPTGANPQQLMIYHRNQAHDDLQNITIGLPGGVATPCNMVSKVWDTMNGRTIVNNPLYGAMASGSVYEIAASINMPPGSIPSYRPWWMGGTWIIKLYVKFIG